MWVADDRVEKYLAAGHRLAADAVKPTEAREKSAEVTEAEKTEVAPVQPAEIKAESKPKRSRKGKG